MQVVGLTVAEGLVAVVASRTGRPAVREWAERVLRRHVRRERSLLVAVRGAKLAAAMEADGLSPEVRQRIVAAARTEQFYAPSTQALQAFFTRACDTMDWIESLREDDRRIRRIDRMSWPDAEKLAEEWHASLARARAASADIMEGAVKAMDLGDGAFAAYLETKRALASEGRAMGHCVGGYWDRVASGGTRIVSIRDADGQPHVTVELAGPSEITFEDGGAMKVARVPLKGVNSLVPVEGGWVAVQVRGKQNRPPVPRWQKLASDFFMASGIPVAERGELSYAPTGSSAVTVATVFRKHYRRLDLAAREGEREFAREYRKGWPKGFEQAYEECGLAAVHEALGGDEAVTAFLEAMSPRIVASFHEKLWKRTAFPVAFKYSGMERCHRAISRNRGHEEAAGMVYGAAAKADPAEVSSRELVLAALGGVELKAVIHEVPLMPLQALSAGLLGGREDVAAAVTRAALGSVLSHMQRRPESVHVLTAAAGRVTPEDTVKAFLFCGLAAEYAAVTEAVFSGVKASVSSLRQAVKKARPTTVAEQERVNRVRNFVSDGWESRVEGRIVANMMGNFPGNPLVVCPAPPRRVAPLRSPPQESLKLYRRP